jgi:signal transduction histidine kinase
MRPTLLDVPLLTPLSLRWRWHSTTFRLMAVYTVIFSVSVMLLIGFIGWAVAGAMEHEADVVMDWQLIYFDSMPHSDVTEAIYRRIEHERMHTNYYGLFTADGQHIAGDMLALPPGLPVNRSGVTLRSLAVAGSERAPVVRVMAEQRDDGEKLVLARDLTHVLKIRQRMINALIIGGILCMAVGIAGCFALSLRQAARLKAIRSATQLIAQGDLGQRLPAGGRDEIDMLVHLVNHMLEEVERLMNEVKGVCDGIAHDLRTPLAHMHTLLGQAAERTGKLDDQEVSILVERARVETTALLDRFRAMLRISEIGTLQRRGGFAPLQLENLVREVGDLYEPLAESRSIHFIVRTRHVGAIRADRDLLFEALCNLLDNALKFTPTGGTVRIELNPTPAGPKVEVIDNGPGIPQADRDAVLQRFYRSERTHHIAGSGLGLSIVSTVMHVHDFTIKLHDARPGTRATIECWSRILA